MVVGEGSEPGNGRALTGSAVMAGSEVRVAAMVWEGCAGRNRVHLDQLVELVLELHRLQKLCSSDTREHIKQALAYLCRSCQEPESLGVNSP
jgi:hypothetical protein